MKIPETQAKHVPLRTSAADHALLRMIRCVFPRVAIIGLSFLTFSCASTHTVYSGKVISRLTDDPRRAPSGVLGCPSELRVLNKDCSLWTYYFTETDSRFPPTNSKATISFRGPACSLLVMKFTVWTDGTVFETGSGSYQPFGRHYYRKLNDEDGTDLEWILEYKAYERSFEHRH